MTDDMKKELYLKTTSAVGTITIIIGTALLLYKVAMANLFIKGVFLGIILTILSMIFVLGLFLDLISARVKE